MQKTAAENVHSIRTQKKNPGIRIGKIMEITEQGQVLVEYPGNILGPLTARFSASMTTKLRNIQAAVDYKVLLAFENDDPNLPIIIDIVCDSIGEASEKEPIAFQVDEAENIFIDGKRFTFDAKEQIVLRCGKSSITLTRAGKVLIKGAYLVNRSSGVNRIRGAAVHIN